MDTQPFTFKLNDRFYWYFPLWSSSDVQTFCYKVISSVSFPRYKSCGGLAKLGFTSLVFLLQYKKHSDSAIHVKKKIMP